MTSSVIGWNFHRRLQAKDSIFLSLVDLFTVVELVWRNSISTYTHTHTRHMHIDHVTNSFVPSSLLVNSSLTSGQTPFTFSHTYMCSHACLLLPIILYMHLLVCSSKIHRPLNTETSLSERATYCKLPGGLTSICVCKKHPESLVKLTFGRASSWGNYAKADIGTQHSLHISSRLGQYGTWKLKDDGDIWDTQTHRHIHSHI